MSFRPLALKATLILQGQSQGVEADPKGCFGTIESIAIGDRASMDARPHGEAPRLAEALGAYP
jgi:hypothetical protein